MTAKNNQVFILTVTTNIEVEGKVLHQAELQCSNAEAWALYFLVCDSTKTVSAKLRAGSKVRGKRGLQFEEVGTYP